jgi:hypothetical protein
LDKSVARGAETIEVERARLPRLNGVKAATDDIDAKIAEGGETSRGRALKPPVGGPPRCVIYGPVLRLAQDRHHRPGLRPHKRAGWQDGEPLHEGMA